jgi:hypothetical protein
MKYIVLDFFYSFFVSFIDFIFRDNDTDVIITNEYYICKYLINEYFFI